MLSIARLPITARQSLTAIPSHRSVDSFVDLFFPVHLVPVRAVLDDRFIRSDFQAVVRSDVEPPVVLGIHGPDYRLVRNADVFDAFETALRQSVLSLEGMVVHDELSHQGARAVRTYVFPAHGVHIARVGDVVDLRLQVVNSYDGSCAFGTILGGYRLICSNGMVIGKTFAQSSAKHTQGFDLGFLLRQLNGAIDAYCASSAQWQRWSNLTVTNTQVEQVLRAFPQSNEKLHERLLSLYAEERALLGPTLWSVFNALTSYSSHSEVKNTAQGNRASIVLQREQRVRSVLHSEPWRRLASA